jgi:hypothetical protein
MFVLKQSSLTFLAGAAVTLALAACNSSEAPTSMLTQSDAQSLGQGLTAEVSALNEGTTYSSSSSMPVSAASTNLDLAPASTTAGCTPAKSPASPANSDGDPVPDSVRIDFTGCTFSGDGHTATLSGSIDIVDPTPATTDRAFRTRSNAFTRSVTSSATGTTRSVVENGVRSVVGTPDQIQLLDTTQTDYTYGSGATASHARKWLATFAADQAGSIQMAFRLPSGNWSISGSSTYTSGTNSYSLSVTTSAPLHYNASCSTEPRFDSGTLTVQVTKGTTSTTVTIAFTACGQYTVTKSAP